MSSGFLKALLLVTVLACGSARAADAWSHLTDWDGKYPSDQVGATKAGLLEQPALRAALKKLLPRAEAGTLAKLDVEAPVKKSGDYLLVNKCRPNNCAADMALIVIDLKTQKLWAGFFSREDGRASTRWYGSADDYSVLPEDIRKEFLSRHGD